MAVRRARRALAEFRIRGVSTNIPFLEAVLADPVFQAGEARRPPPPARSSASTQLGAEGFVKWMRRATNPSC
jgi:acetyl/propionyl-CoA carboxylase alpha subunit